MSGSSCKALDSVVLETQAIDLLLEILNKKKFRAIGPRLQHNAIVYDELHSAADLPVGWTDEQRPGSYRLKEHHGQALFPYRVGPYPWKKLLYPPALRLWQAKRNGNAIEVIAGKHDPTRYALVGVRSCDLHAISIQDRVLLNGPYADPAYKVRRENLFIIAVNCSKPGGTCFCASMGTGPRAVSGFDLALTEVFHEGRHAFVVEVGTDAGAEIVQKLPHQHADKDQEGSVDEALNRSAENMGRTLDTQGIKELLYGSWDHPHWEDLARRCMNCANCTLVCPTCFCTTVEDTTDLSGEYAERRRRWDSCHTMGFSYLHGGSVRFSAGARYRQWMTHKLASWQDQFGSSGCVGCGRCITWCPVGIDITQEVRALRDKEINHADP